MRIAFDLDGTLIPKEPGEFSVLPTPIPFRWLFADKLREGAPSLLRELQAEGHEIWVYTSSLRSKRHIWLLFFAMGIRLAGVVNGDAHAEAVRGRTRRPSKFPPAFGIDLLVDDSVGVELEGRQHGFRVVRVDAQDNGWADKVRIGVMHAV